MATETELKAAKAVYKTLIDTLDERDWKYEKKEDELSVHFLVGGDDIPMIFFVVVDAERQLVRIISPLPFKVKEDKRIEGAIATSHANYKMLDGSFDYDITDGEIRYRMTSSFMDSLISKDLFYYMIQLSIDMVDEFNDKFFRISEGDMSLEEFIKAY